MIRKRKIQKSKYITVFAITTLIFIIGILLGNFFAEKKIDDVNRLGQDFRTDTMSLEVQYDLMAEQPCNSTSETPLSEQLYELATKLDYMENTLGEDDEDVIALKEYYGLLEIRHWMFSKKTKIECGHKKALILYFYSNKKHCPECEEQGFILTWLRRNYENVLVYAFDYYIDNSAINTIKTIYGINNTPAVVINDEVYNKYMSKAELEEMMKQQNISLIMS